MSAGIDRTWDACWRLYRIAACTDRHRWKVKFKYRRTGERSWRTARTGHHAAVSPARV